MTATVVDGRPPAGDVAAAPRRPSGRGLPIAVLAVAGAAAAVWVAVAVRASGRGLDLSDEGFYLLSYRWWSVEHHNFTGAQYLYGPVFQLLGYDIAALRLVRLGTVLATFGLFGWAVMNWLRPRRPAAPATRLWEAAGAAAILAGAGPVYGWLPQSPGYNDVVLFGAVLGMAVALRASTVADRGARAPWWLPAAWGLLVVPVVLAKWSGVAVLALTGAALAVALWPGGPRALGRAAAQAFAAAAAFAGLLHLVVVPLPVAVPGLLAVNTELARGTMGFGDLLLKNWERSAPLLADTGLQHGPLLLALAGAVVLRTRIARWAGWALAAAALATSAWFAVAGGGLGGGRRYLLEYVVILLGLAAFALVALVAVPLYDRLRRDTTGLGAPSSLSADRARGRFLLLALFLVPFVYALGTSNAPPVLWVNGFALWVAVLVAVLTGMESAPPAARALTAVVTAAAVLIAPCVAVGGLWRYPHRTAPQAQATAPVPGVPPLASLTLSPATAAQFRALRRVLRPHLRPGRPMLAFDESAGLVLALGGRPAGEPWISRDQPARTAAGIVAECRAEGPWRGPTAPILLFRRPVTAADAAALGRCGIDLATDYRRLPFHGGTIVLVPVADAVG